MVLIEDPELSRRFPAERWARVRITLKGGRVLSSEPAVARGNPQNPLSDEEIVEKFRANAEPVLGRDRASRIEICIASLGSDHGQLKFLMNEILATADRAAL